MVVACAVSARGTVKTPMTNMSARPQGRGMRVFLRQCVGGALPLPATARVELYKRATSHCAGRPDCCRPRATETDQTGLVVTEQSRLASKRIR